MPMRVTPETLARAMHQMMPVLAGVDIETQEALSRLCNPLAEFRRDDGLAIAVAYLLELRSRPSSKRR
jgi:hypothetical protein